MIGRIRGTLIEKSPPHILVDVNGVGYDIDVPMSTFYALPVEGQSVQLSTHLIVREDAHQLYGFLTEAERICFRELIRISGVGARIGLAILSGLSIDELVSAVQSHNAAKLTTVPGIGKKTAERLLLELGDRLSKQLNDLSLTAPNIAPTATTIQGDVVRALLALGYSDKEASQAARNLPADISVSDGIRMALKTFTR